MFPEGDSSSKDISHMYFGGKKLLKLDETIPEINIDTLARNMTIFLKDQHRNNYKRELIKFAKENQIALTQKNLLDISSQEISTEYSGANRSDKISPSSIILTNNSNGENLSNIQYVINLENPCTSSSSVGKNGANRTLKNHDDYRSYDIALLIDRCRLLQEFESGNRRLSHHELIGIGNTMIQIETGVTRFIDIIKSNSYFDDRVWKYDKWKNDLDYNRSKGYKPTRCNVFCPYKDICTHTANILTTVKPKQGTMERISGYKDVYYTLDEAVKSLEYNIQCAIDANDDMIHVIKSPTATGKTEICLDIMKNSDQRFYYANPANVLKDDVFRRALEKDIDVFRTPSLHDKSIRDYLPDDVRRRIDYLYDSGQHRAVDPYIAKVADEKNIGYLKEYLLDKEMFHKTDANVISTHRKLLHMDEEALGRFGVRIIDEDFILKTVIPNQVEITLTQLKQLLQTIWMDILAGKASMNEYHHLIKKIQRILKHSETKSKFELPGFEWDYGEESKINKKTPPDGTPTPIDVPSLCLAKNFFIRRASEEKDLAEDTLVFLKPVNLKKGFKYIIISATADEYIYKQYFGADRIKFYECKNAAYTGALYQYYGKSMSRSCLYANPGIFESIHEITGDIPTLTFKGFLKPASKYFTSINDVDLYFGNAEGVDFLKGLDINVIGTPYQAEFIYKLFAYTIGIDFDDDAKPVKNLPVTHNGYRFTFTTYENEELRKLQFWMIESDLEQAVGRARLLRFDCIVYLFSNFPLRQSVMTRFEYSNKSTTS